MKRVKEKLERLRASLAALPAAPDGGEKAAWDSLLDLAQALADALADLEEAQEDADLYIETIDEDLTRLEMQLYGADDEEEDNEPPPYLDA